MADHILDEAGNPIGVVTGYRDPNAPSRYVHTESGQRFVVPEGKTELDVLAEIPVDAHTGDELASPWTPEAQAVVDAKVSATSETE